MARDPQNSPCHHPGASPQLASLSKQVQEEGSFNCGKCWSRSMTQATEIHINNSGWDEAAGQYIHEGCSPAAAKFSWACQPLMRTVCD